MSELTDLQAKLSALRQRLGGIGALDRPALDAEHTAVLGRRQGALTALLRALPSLAPAERVVVGREANELRQAFEHAFEERQQALAVEALLADSAARDLTMPGRGRWTGGTHPVTRVMAEICEIFRELGFTRAVGPEAETEWYNFTSLNFPPDHPALDQHDTLYLDTGERRSGEERRRRPGAHPGVERRVSGQDRRAPGGRILLRTHTSPVQIRTMLAWPPPIRVVIPGMVYRKDTFDASHAPAFSQIEGLVVDEGVSFVDLKATLAHFARRFFRADTLVRFRPSYFPFTEPSAEMDVSCALCSGGGCPACKQSGWMEILGCGMVHPAVFEAAGVDPERYTGFAFGMGPHRIAMLRYGIPDIRLLCEGDMRFLGQFERPRGAGA